MDLDTLDVDEANRPRYDLPTAVTFLIAGLGLGSVLTLLFSPRLDGNSLLPSGMSARPAR